MRISFVGLEEIFAAGCVVNDIYCLPNCKTHLMRKSKALTMLLFFVKIFNTFATQITSLILAEKFYYRRQYNERRMVDKLHEIKHFMGLYFRTHLKCVSNMHNISIPIKYYVHFKTTKKRDLFVQNNLFLFLLSLSIILLRVFCV